MYILADVYPEALGFRQQRLTVTEKAMREGERGIIYGIRKINPKEGHVFNVIKHKGQIKYLDGQAAIPAEIRGGNYKLFEYLQTYKPN